MKPHKLKDGRTVYLERRRYSTKTYCWVYRKHGEQFQLIAGDPWPAVTPPDKWMTERLDTPDTQMLTVR